MNLFKPKEKLMPQLDALTNETTAKQWWKEYLEFHNGKDQGIWYLIGYFNTEKTQQLKTWFGI